MAAGKDRTGSGRLVTQPTSLSQDTPHNYGKHEEKTTRRSSERLEIDGPNRTDYMATMMATETDNENTGWEKVTTYRGLRIHQGKEKCSQRGQQRPPPTTPQELEKVKQVVKKARSSSAPGPNGVLYKLYKNLPKVLELLWYLMRTAWKKQIIPSEWQRAVAVFIPREANSKDIGQFRNIALLNVEGKIFFAVLARRMTTYLLENGYIDTSCQKAGVPGFPGCVEQSAMIWDQIQRVGEDRSSRTW